MSGVFISAAIDFGTTFSSWAFSFKHHFKQEPTRVTTRRWKSQGNHFSLKAPTCILILPDGETMDSFGYDAERKYALLSEENKHTDWYFFRHFKMQLYSKNVDRHMKLKDVYGKKLLAKTIFALSIKFLKDDLMETVRKGLMEKEGQCSSSGSVRGTQGVDETEEIPDEAVKNVTTRNKVPSVEESDFRWVITVPAIWNDAAKQFMREAANEAGISTENLYIGLEPEAASIYSRFLPAVDCKGSLSDLQPGSKYMILDAGGGTVDITVHEVGSNGRLKEIHKASGGNWGGTRVDEEYWSFLEKIFGKDILQKMKFEYMEDYLQMICDFEIKKRLTQPDLGEKVTVRIPASFQDVLCEERSLTLKEYVARSPYKDTLVVSGDKMRIDFKTFQDFFDIAVHETINQVSKILKHPDVSGCETILMVGGFSESIILQEAMLNSFPKMNLVIPSETELCIIKGAVIYGHDPSIIAERKLKYTYGTAVVHEKGSFECKHRPGKTEVLLGVLSCVDIFHAHVRMGQVVRLSEEQEEQTYSPLHPLAPEMDFQVFSSTEENPTFVTDDSCRCIGTLRVSVTPNILGAMAGLRIGHEVGVTFIFGGTEIKVKAVDRVSGKEVGLIMDCLDEI